MIDEDDDLEISKEELCKVVSVALGKAIMDIYKYDDSTYVVNFEEDDLEYGSLRLIENIDDDLVDIGNEFSNGKRITYIDMNSVDIYGWAHKCKTFRIAFEDESVKLIRGTNGEYVDISTPLAGGEKVVDACNYKKTGDFTIEFEDGFKKFIREIDGEYQDISSRFLDRSMEIVNVHIYEDGSFAMDIFYDGSQKNSDMVIRKVGDEYVDAKKIY